MSLQLNRRQERAPSSGHLQQLGLLLRGLGTQGLDGHRVGEVTLEETLTFRRLTGRLLDKWARGRSVLGCVHLEVVGVDLDGPSPALEAEAEGRPLAAGDLRATLVIQWMLGTLPGAKSWSWTHGQGHELMVAHL